MPDAALRDVVLKRLEKAAHDNNQWYPLVMAALEGQSELQKQLDETAAKPAQEAAGDTATAIATATAEAPPRIAFLRSVTVEGFRGIGNKATLDLTPGPGLTLVVGRNGSGKSSFAEGLELLLTGETYRWENRSKVWKGGWRNLHQKKTALTACLALEGEKGPCTVSSSRAPLGWTDALASYRPFLSYNELGSMLDEGPSELYDALAKILGLDDLVQTQAALQEERSTREKAHLAPVADERAKKAREALARKDDWGLDTVEATVAGTTQGDAESLIDLLKRLAVFAVPEEAAVNEAVDIDLAESVRTLQVSRPGAAL